MSSIVIQSIDDKLLSGVHLKYQWQDSHETTHQGRTAFLTPNDQISTLIEALGIYRRRGISLSGSYQRGYSTTYNTRSHIKVVCNGYILTHISNWNSQSVPKTIPSMGRPPSDMIRGTWPICMQVKCTRVNIVTFWHGF